MIQFFIRYKKPIFIITVAGFLIATFVGLGAYITSDNNGTAVATVNGVKIPYRTFLTQVNKLSDNLRNSGTEVNDALSKMIKQEVLRELVVEELFLQQAQKLDMRVSDYEVAYEIQATPAFRNGKNFDSRAYYQIISRQLGMNPEEYEAWRKKARMSNLYSSFVSSAVKVTPEEAKAYAKLAKADDKDFEKNKVMYTQEALRYKSGMIGQYLLAQLTSGQSVKNYLSEREQGM